MNSLNRQPVSRRTTVRSVTHHNSPSSPGKLPKGMALVGNSQGRRTNIQSELVKGSPTQKKGVTTQMKGVTTQMKGEPSQKKGITTRMKSIITQKKGATTQMKGTPSQRKATTSQPSRVTARLISRTSTRRTDVTERDHEKSKKQLQQASFINLLDRQAKKSMQGVIGVRPRLTTVNLVAGSTSPYGTALGRKATTVRMSTRKLSTVGRGALQAGPGKKTFKMPQIWAKPPWKGMSPVSAVKTQLAPVVVPLTRLGVSPPAHSRKRLTPGSAATSRKLKAPPSKTSQSPTTKKKKPILKTSPRKRSVGEGAVKVGEPPKREEILKPTTPQLPVQLNGVEIIPKMNYTETINIPNLKVANVSNAVLPFVKANAVVEQAPAVENKLTVIQRNLMEPLSNPTFKSLGKPLGLQETTEPTKTVARPVFSSQEKKASPLSHMLNPYILTPFTRIPEGDDTYLDYRHFKGLLPKHQFYLLQTKVVAALNAQRTFAVVGGRSYGIEVALRRRGWIQKFAETDGMPGSYLPGRVTHAPDNELMIVSKLMKRPIIRFFWIYGAYNWSAISPGTIVNKFPFMNYSFSTKVGLCKILYDQHWTRKPDEALVQYPRTFEIHTQEDLKHFAKKYRITACLSLARFFANRVAVVGQNNYVIVTGKVSLSCIDFAVQRLCEYVNYKEHADLDVWDSSEVSEDEWTTFLDDYYSVVNDGEKFNNTCNYNVQKLVEASRKCVDAVKPYWPNMIMEGYRNVWIVKPGASNRGRGIVLEKTLQGILNFCKNRNHYVIQKYIEKPLLVSNTKFDIRQWFLVTSVYPLTIWMYNECYLRFSSQLYSLGNLHESVHLCNYSIQHKYKNCERSSLLPPDNMWDSLQFLEYLKQQGQLDKWSNIVVPQMQTAIVGALLASQDRMTHRVNSFSLYGADFLLAEDFSPWLIEINAQPDMGHTTRVTSRMCPEVLEDVCKVVVDRRDDERAKTGKFRLAYRQKLTTPQSPRGDLMLMGKRMRIYKSGEAGPPVGKLEGPLKASELAQRMKAKEQLNENCAFWRSIKYERLAVYKSERVNQPKTSGDGAWLLTEGYTGSRPVEPGDPIPPAPAQQQKSSTSESSSDISAKLQNTLKNLTF